MTIETVLIETMTMKEVEMEMTQLHAGKDETFDCHILDSAAEEKILGTSDSPATWHVERS
eukprot:366157-Hanusia_phi.AAC.4